MGDSLKRETGGVRRDYGSRDGGEEIAGLGRRRVGELRPDAGAVRIRGTAP
jgi:hypothetical protein